MHLPIFFYEVLYCKYFWTPLYLTVKTQDQLLILGLCLQEEHLCVYHFLYEVPLYQFLGYPCAKQTKIYNFPRVLSPRETVIVFTFFKAPFGTNRCCGHLSTKVSKQKKVLNFFRVFLPIKYFLCTTRSYYTPFWEIRTVLQVHLMYQCLIFQTVKS